MALPPNNADAPAVPARFTEGSILNHVLVMAGTGTIGLLAIFVGDLANIIFLSFDNDVEVVAAAGYGSSILYLMISLGIGTSIAAAAIVSPALGAGDRERARRLITNTHLFTALAAVVTALIVWPNTNTLLGLIGAKGRTLALASDFLVVLTPAFIALAVAMTSNAALRSLGDANRAMLVTLGGACVNVILDAILILGLGLGIYGAAWASVIARLTMMAIGFWGVGYVQKAFARPSWPLFLDDVPTIARVAVPAILTNIATPIAGAYVTSAIAPYGDAAVAGFAIVGRIQPVAFGGLFALSGSISPILGQNLGAKRFDRVRTTMTESLKVTVVYSLVTWLILLACTPWLINVFHATGDTRHLIELFCWWLAPWFVFLGVMFVSNAAFNTMGKPELATVFNWARATIGTFPFVLLGGWLAGSSGVLAASLLGAIPFAVVAMWLCYRLIDHIEVQSRGIASKTAWWLEPRLAAARLIRGSSV